MSHPELVSANWNINDYPARLVDGAHSVQPDDANVSTTMDSGMVRKRRSVTMVFDRTKIRWLIPSDKIRLFRLWYAYDLNQGQKWFNINLINGFEEDCTPEVKQCNISPPTFTKRGNLWEIVADARMVSDNGYRVNDSGSIEFIPPCNVWDDSCTWTETCP